MCYELYELKPCFEPVKHPQPSYILAVWVTILLSTRTRLNGVVHQRLRCPFQKRHEEWVPTIDVECFECHIGHIHQQN